MTTLQQAVATAADGLTRVYETNAVPSSPAHPYSVFSASLGRGVVVTLDGREGGRDARIVAQHYAKTLTGANQFAEDFRDRVVGVWLDFDGYSPALVRAELDPTPVGRDPDDNGVVTVTATYTLTVTKEQP